MLVLVGALAMERIAVGFIVMCSAELGWHVAASNLSAQPQSTSVGPSALYALAAAVLGGLFMFTSTTDASLFGAAIGVVGHIVCSTLLLVTNAPFHWLHTVLELLHGVASWTALMACVHIISCD
jgi:uncharacterized membrane protein